MQHDASRCVQGVLQFGTEAMKREVVMELCCGHAGGGGSSSSSSRSGIGGGAVAGSGEDSNTTKKKGDEKFNLAELCKIQYAHFVVLKMIKYCARDEVCVKLIVKSLKKQMTKLVVHSVAARVVELLFATFPSKLTRPLKLELYGPQYALFATTATAITTTTPTSSMVDDKSMPNGVVTQPHLPTLSVFLRTHPEKREPTLVYLQSILQKGLDKNLVGFAYFHSLLHDYVTVTSSEDIRSFLTPAVADHALHLLSTRHGTHVVCECVAYGTVKDRKRILKCLKGYTRSSLLHRDAYLAILRVCDVMDDTVLVNKMIFAELHQNTSSLVGSNLKKGKKEVGSEGDDEETNKEEEEIMTSPILDLVLSDTGSKLFLFLLVSKEEEVQQEHPVSKEGGNNGTKTIVISSATATSPATTTPRWQKYFDPYELSVLHRNPTITENGTDVPVPTSKKADETRRQELLIYLKELLVGVCTHHAEEMLRSKVGSRVLLEVCDCYPCEEVYNAIVKACGAPTNSKDSTNNNDNDRSLPMFNDPIGHLTLKNIFLSESKKAVIMDDTEVVVGPTLARTFFNRFHTCLGDMAYSNRGAFVLSALLGTCVGMEVRSALVEHRKEIAKLANGLGKEKKNKLAGCGVLLEMLKKK